MIPVKIVACDLHTMEEVIYQRGKLVDAIRASISIPGIFRPMRHLGRKLIDGGLASPVPVGLLHRQGISRIIAVNTFPDPDVMRKIRHREELSRIEPRDLREPMRESGPIIDTPGGLIKMYMRFLNATQARVAEAECRRADIVLSPTLMDGFWYDFYNPERYIRRGEEVAEAALPELRELIGATRAPTGSAPVSQAGIEPPVGRISLSPSQSASTIRTS
jgi:NTE family protein